MGSIIAVKTQAISLVVACVQWREFYCHECMDDSWPTPEPHRHIEHTFPRTVVRWLGKNDDFLDPVNHETYEQPRNVDIYYFFGADMRSIARDIRSRDLFESGRQVYCAHCYKRLLTTTQPETGIAQVEYHKAKIF